MTGLESAKDILINDGALPFIVVDASPLIHLVGSGVIHDLKKTGSTIVVPDLVAIEATIKGKPFAEDVASCIDNGVLQVSQTATGDMYRAALKGEPSFRAKDAGERAIIDWLLDTIDDTPTPAIVVYENGKVPGLIDHHDMNATVSVLTTRMLIHVLSTNSLTSATWNDLISLFPTINQKTAESHSYYMKP